MKKRFFTVLLCLCMLAGLVPNMNIAPAADTPAYGIDETVFFAGHKWYIIGTPTEGVKAPAGCYTLLAKNNDFGSTTFRAGGDTQKKLLFITRTATCKKRWWRSQTAFPKRTKTTFSPAL